MPQVTTTEAASSLVLPGLDVGEDYIFRVGVENADGTIEFSEWSSPTRVTLVTGTLQSGQDVDIGTGKILYSNVYDTLADLPEASSYHGMFAHVHAEGAAYYAHAGNWVRLANNSSVPSSYISTLNGLSGAVTIGAGSGVTVTQAGSTLLISAAGAVTSVNAEAGALTLVGGDNIGIATQDGIITITGQASGVTWSTAPLTPNDPGSEGDIAYNDDYFFVRTSQGWRRTAISTWDAEIVISSQPQNLSLAPGGSGNFTVTAAASDGSTVAYQWQNSDDNGTTWDTIAGATSATYGLSNVALSDSGGLYRVTVSAANVTSVTSDSATLTVANSYDLLTEGGDTITSEAGDQINQESGGGGGGGEEQVGSTLTGDVDGDQFGTSVAISNDGSRLAVGAREWASGGTGYVRVFDWGGSAWSQLGADIDGQVVEGRFGSSVSISSAGDVIAVGEILSNSGASNGTVRVYGWSGSAWAQIGSDIVGEAAGDRFGESVSLSSDGSRVAIGASNNDGTAGGAGHVRVYGWSGSSWSQIGSDIDGEAYSDWSGESVSLSGDGTTVAIGARGNDGGGLGFLSGHTRVYRVSGGVWTQLGSDIDGEAYGDKSGSSVSLSDDGNRVAIGATSNSTAINTAGHVRVFDWTGSAWVQAGADIDGESSNDQSGWAVSLSGDGNALAVSAPYNDDGGANAGHVRIYSWDGSAWAQVGPDYDGDAAGDYLGYGEKPVAISGDGTRFAASAMFGSNNRGYVKVWDVATLPTITFNSHPQDAAARVLDLSPTNLGDYDNATFSASATASDGSAVQYQWQEYYNSQWVDLTGYTSATASIPVDSFSYDGAQYRVIASSATAPAVASQSAQILISQPTATYGILPTSQGQAYSGMYSISLSGGNAPIAWGLTRSGTSGSWSAGPHPLTTVTGTTESLNSPLASPYPLYAGTDTYTGNDVFDELGSGSAPASWPAGTYTFTGVISLGQATETDIAGNEYSIIRKQLFNRTITVT